MITRRRFLQTSAAATAVTVLPHSANGAPFSQDSCVVDTHMHVWADDADRYPFAHPYSPEFDEAYPATLEMLVEDMDQANCDGAVLVQCIYHGWDNRYIADCAKADPQRFRAHGLIDPTDPQVAQKLEYWMKEHGLHGMRFSPIYYQDGNHGGDGWLDADESQQLWKTAEKLGAVFNFFIAAQQLPKLENVVRRYPDIPVIIDHISQLDFGATDFEPNFQRLLKMAQYPNVWVKVSELASVSESKKYPFEDAYPNVKRLYEAFGGDQLLFGTGYPGTARAAYDRPTLVKEIELIKTTMPFFAAEDRDKILGGNAKKIWKF